MNLAKYQGYFHDGSLVDIEQFRDEIIFSMISAEIPPNDVFKIKRLIVLSFD